MDSVLYFDSIDSIQLDSCFAQGGGHQKSLTQLLGSIRQMLAFYLQNFSSTQPIQIHLNKKSSPKQKILKTFKVGAKDTKDVMKH